MSDSSRNYRKLIALVAGVATVVAVLFLILQPAPKQPVIVNDIPMPFGASVSDLQGSIVSIGRRNNIDVFEVRFVNNEPFERMLPDRIYLVHVPNDLVGVPSVPVDLAMSLAGTSNHLVDYYGYRYSDAAATLERRDIAAFRFKDRFPAQFFASQTARNRDVQHSNALANFEADNSVTFLPTDGRTGSVRIEPNSLYVFIVNETAGADIRVRGVAGCGNGIKEGVEECDDGNANDNDDCRNNCTLGVPLPFGGTGSAVPMTVTQKATAVSSTATASQQNLTLLKFTASASELTTMRRVSFTAQTGALTSLQNYRLWKDTNSDGTVDASVTAAKASVGNFVSFDIPVDWSGAVLGTQAVTFELRAHAPAVTTGLSPVRVGFAVSQSDYIGAKKNSSTGALAGIRTNGVCPISSCAINVKTAQSTLWSFTSAAAVCGNGAKEGTEACDDSNTANGDGCSSVCAIESGFSCTGSPSVCARNPVCGNGNKETGEACDDSNTANGDGCSNACAVESGYTCTGNPSVCTPTGGGAVCGNGAKEGTEACDDSNTANGDGCSSSCSVESGYTCTGSPSVCTPTSLCGNSVINTGEECDDGNTVDTDDCDNSCHLTTPTPDF